MIEIDEKEWIGTGIPRYMREGLLRYLDQGVPVGTFLEAVLSNDLERAVLHADENNLPVLRGYIRFLRNNAPPLSYGSKAAYDQWVSSGGLRGRADIRAFNAANKAAKRGQP
jgi:hypothetical protein